MRKKSYLVIFLLLICIAGFLCALFVEKKSFKRQERPTFGFTDEMILMEPYFEIVVSAEENKHLNSDVRSYNFGDGFIHLPLPKDVNTKRLVVYFANINGDYLARRELNFTDKVMIGPWEIVVDTNNIPNLYFSSNDNGEEFLNMISSPTKDLMTYGSMQLYVDKDLARKNNWFSEYLSVADDVTTPYSAVLQGRGNSSWECDYKKSYTLRLEKSMNLMGMGSAKSWNLIGNAFDPSLLKNMTYNSLSKKLGIKYQPEMQYVNLYVDGVYQGVYLLTSKVNVAKNRIPLKKGDLLFKMDSPDPTQPLPYESITWFEDGNTAPLADLVYPEYASSEELVYAQAIVQRFINCVENPDMNELAKFVDIDSLIKYYWIQEATMNFDAWQRSVYIYYVKDEDKIYIGPVWDMDLTLGSPYEKAGMMFDSPEGFRICRAGWYRTLFENAEFLQMVIDYYNHGGVKEALLESLNDFYSYKESLGADGELNYKMFGHANMGVTINYGDTYDDYCNGMIEFYRRRLEFIDAEMSKFN